MRRIVVQHRKQERRDHVRLPQWVTPSEQSEQEPAKEELFDKRRDNTRRDQQYNEGKRAFAQRELELLELIRLQANL